MMFTPIKKILIDPAVHETELAVRVLRNRGNIPFEIVHPSSIQNEASSLIQGKQLLWITRTPGGLVKPCPATRPPYLCCQYTTIHAMTQCPFDCTYCILQNYLENPLITLYADQDAIFQDIAAVQQSEPNRFFRFGTGELADSLALDFLTGLSGDYIRFFNSRKNALIELKTKSVQIENLFGLNPKHAVISWSLNPPSVIRKEELRAAPLHVRLQAARRCQDAGYLIGFHFDPLLLFEGWQSAYDDLIRQLFLVVDPGRIAWISLGSLRFPPALMDVMAKRFPKSGIFYEEMIRGLDGKMRYVRPLRMELYRAVSGLIRECAPDVFLYFCMESPAVWNAVFGMHPASNAELDFWFARSVWERFRNEVEMDKPERMVFLNNTLINPQRQ
jgi:spore photoproduct lyase